MSGQRPPGVRTDELANRGRPARPALEDLWARAGPPRGTGRRRRPVLGGHLRLLGSTRIRQPGPSANDIDLLVVGDLDPLDVYEAARIAGKRLGMDVNPVVRSRDEWDRDDTQFAQAVRTGPRIDVAPRRQHG